MKITLTDEEFQYTDILGMPTKKVVVRKIEDDNGNKIYFDKDNVLSQIKDFTEIISNDYSTDDELKEYGINSTIKKFNEAMKKLNTYVSSIDDKALQNIIENAPRLKNGNIRNSKLPLYMTGLTLYEGESGAWARVTSIELSLIPVETYVPVTSPATIFAPPTKTPNAFRIAFTTSDREFKKTDVPIVDKDFNYTKVSYSRNSYIKAEDLVIGNIYKDVKDREFLYLGSIVCSYCTDRFKSSGEDISDEIMRNNEKSYSYVFFKLTDKLKKTKTSGVSFKDFFTPILTKQLKKKNSYHPDEFEYLQFENLFKITKSFKVVEDLGSFFSLDEMKGVIDVEVTDKLGNNYRAIVNVSGVGSKMMYSVYDYNSHSTYKELCYKSFNKSDANEYLKKLKSKYASICEDYAPETYESRYFAETLYHSIPIGYSTDITKLEDIFEEFEKTSEAISEASRYPNEDIKNLRRAPREELFPKAK